VIGGHPTAFLSILLTFFFPVIVENYTVPLLSRTIAISSHVFQDQRFCASYRRQSCVLHAWIDQFSRTCESRSHYPQPQTFDCFKLPCFCGVHLLHCNVCSSYIPFSIHAKSICCSQRRYSALRNLGRGCDHDVFKCFFAAHCMFWATLWLIKFSLLFVYRRLLVGVYKGYSIVWRAIVAICLLVSQLSFLVRLLSYEYSR
jgi:hypothetical protein